jgi:hypothetical protein
MDGTIGRRVMAAALLASAVMALTAAPLRAQTPSVNLLNSKPPPTQEELDKQAEIDQAYKDSLKKLPSSGAKADPWGGARTVDDSHAASKPKKKSN